MVTRYIQPNETRNYVNDNSNLENTATERPKKKSNLLRNLAITGAIVGGLACGAGAGLMAFYKATEGIGEGMLRAPLTMIESEFNVKFE